jgi:hypothetical protein
MNTTYRMYAPNDIDALVQFWKENAGWDQIDRKEWERRFHGTPYGNASVAIAEDMDSGSIVGQFLFIPTVISIDGKEVKGFRPFAPVVKESVRAELGLLTLMEIVLKMYNYAMDEFKKDGVGVIHMLPDPRWAKAFEFIPDAQVDYFPLWSLNLPLQQKFSLPDAYTVSPIQPNDERINILWEKNSKLYGCIFPRNTVTLPWKTSHGNYQTLGVFHKDELIGVSVSIVKANDKQWLICDIITSDGEEAMEATVKATCNKAQDFIEANEEATIHKIAILATPLIQKKIEGMGFKNDHYRFPIVIQALDPSLTKEEVAPQRWYASAND